jgi:16S rRNA (uracil1498-N3)-methyltransferase
MGSLVRLHLDQPLAKGQTVPLTEAQANYLVAVMRLPVGAPLLVFNGRDGEWQARLAGAQRRGATLSIGDRTRPPRPPPDLWLMFAPLKKARTDFVVEKAVELGCARILPVVTEYTRAERVREDRLKAHAVEAAEQCGAVFVPPVEAARRLDSVLAGWEAGRDLWFCDEGLAEGEGGPIPPESCGPGPGAVLVGPEGGFSPAERARLGALPCVRPIRLGPRILRAETAAVAALVLWQMARGDWR